MRDKIQLIAKEITEVDPNFEREMRGFLDVSIIMKTNISK